MGGCQLSTQDENYVHCIRRISNRAEDGWDDDVRYYDGGGWMGW